jgi:hypothetical protein
VTGRIRPLIYRESGGPRKITGEQVGVQVTRTLTEQGRGQDAHWSTRTMAAESGLSQSSVSRIWRAFGLKPHVAETWKLSTDPEFVAQVRDQWILDSGHWLLIN